MGFSIGGTEASKVYIGDTEVSKVYVGASQVWAATVAAVPTVGTVVLAPPTPDNTNTTGYTLAIPSTSSIPVNELMVLIGGSYTAGTIATPSGWTLHQTGPTTNGAAISVFSKRRASGDSSVTLNFISSDGHGAALIGVKNATTITNATAIKGEIVAAGSVMPSMTTVANNALNLNIVYVNHNSVFVEPTFSGGTSSKVAFAQGGAAFKGDLVVVSQFQPNAGPNTPLTVSYGAAKTLAVRSLISIT